MKNLQTFDNFISDINEATSPFVKDINKEHDKQQGLTDSIYDFFYQVFDEDASNLKKNPWLSSIYNQLKPVIIPGDDVGLLISNWVLEENKKITKELERIQRLLIDAKKKIK